MPDRSNIQHNQQMRLHSQTQKDANIDRMSKLKIEIEYLERRMQQIRTTPTKLQQDPTQAPVTLRVDSIPNEIIFNKIIVMGENRVGTKRVTSLLTQAHIPLWCNK